MSNDVTDFEKEIIARSREVPVLVDFWAPWCGPCKMLGPVLDKLAAQATGRWELAKVNVDEHQNLAGRYDISSIPNVKLFSGGEVIDEFVGMLPEAEIRRWLEKALPSPTTGVVDQAAALVANGAHSEAARLLEPVVSAEPGNETARLLLAQCLLGPTPERVESLLAGIDESSDAADKANALRTLAGLIQRAKSSSLPEAPVRARFIEGTAAVAKGDHVAALEAFIEVLQRRRDYGEEAAKDACKAIFQLLGIRHPVSERYHRAFSSALYS